MTDKTEIRDQISTEEGLEKIKELAKSGMTLAQIANEYGVTRNTLYRWSKSNPDIQSALSEGRKSADERVENSLYEQCFDRPTNEETVEYDDTGRIVKRITKTKILPASVTAIQYWLANRSEGKWKAKQQLELTGSPSAPVVFIQDVPKESPDGNPLGVSVIFKGELDECITGSSKDDAKTKEHDEHQPTNEQ